MRSWIASGTPGRWRRVVRPLAAVTVAAIAGWLLVVSGVARDTVATLVVIGFSPDRSRLLTALILEAAAVSLAIAVTGSRRAAQMGGVLVAAAYFRRTFLDETATALGQGTPLGAFDPSGWLLTLATLLVTGLLVAWMTGLIAAAARGQVLDAVNDLRRVVGAIRARPGRPALDRLARPARVAVVLGLLAVTLPVLGDMLNFEPDVHMRSGTASVVPVPSDGSGLGSPSVGPGPSVVPVGPATVSGDRPWLAWRPSGHGSTQTLDVPAPWGGGSTVQLTVYLPPGYGTGANVRYPVLYEAPWSSANWDRAANLAVQMDTLTDAGDIPPALVVFMNQSGGPYPDSECADSYDGREWYDRWVVQTVVPEIDAAFPTIATPEARALIGFSHGGFCAASLLLRHPDLFGSALAFSGYYQAGIVTNQTTNAALPFNGNPQLEAAYSPDALAPRVPAPIRSRLFVELTTSPHENFYGPQYLSFARVLQAAKIPVELFPTAVGHSWAEVRSELAGMLEAWSAHLAASNVFAS